MNELTDIMSLNPAELIKWCKARKATLHLSNQRLSELTGVPAGTIDRIMSGNYNEFRYSTVQPIISLLIGYREETPRPDESDTAQGDFYYETIEGYKLVVENKNHEIAELSRAYESRVRAVEYLKAENARKDELISGMAAHIKWMESKIQ